MEQYVDFYIPRSSISHRHESPLAEMRDGCVSWRVGATGSKGLQWYRAAMYRIVHCCHDREFRCGEGRLGGVYEEDPAQNPHARCYREIDASAAVILAGASTSTRVAEMGGMHQKLFQAVRCVEMGMRVAIAEPGDDNILRFAAGESVGTMVCL